MQVLKEFYLYYFMKIGIYWRVSILATLVIFGLIMYTLYKKAKLTGLQAISIAFLSSWIWFVLVSTLLARDKLYETYQYNLKLLWQIRNIILSDTLYDKFVHIRYVGYNFLMLLPLGFFLSIITKKKRLVISSFSGIILSIVIESMQFLSMRGLFEVDDIVYNTLGVVSGHFLYRVCEMLFSRGRKFRKK